MLQQQFVVFWADYVLDYFLTGPSYTKLTGMKFHKISAYFLSAYWMAGCRNVFGSTSQRLESSGCRYRWTNTTYWLHECPAYTIVFVCSACLSSRQTQFEQNVFTCRWPNVKHSEAWNVHPVKRSHIKTVSEGISLLDVTITARDKNLVDFLISN